MKIIYFAGGCFWGVEEFFLRQKGILDTKVGYLNSQIQNPTYQQVCAELTNATEAVKITYDPNLIDLLQLLKLFFSIIDPFSLNQQGNDVGTQYRTGVYYENDEELKSINNFFLEYASKVKLPIMVEVLKMQNFYLAEEFHQKYLQKNPNGYCHIKLPPIENKKKM